MEIYKKENEIQIIVPVTKYYSYIFVFGVSSIMMISILIFWTLKAIITYDFNLPEKFIGYLIFGPIFLNIALWLLIGTEKIILRKDTLELTKSNRIITFKKSYELKEIKNITVVDKKYKSESFLDTKREKIREKQRLPFWWKMGKILFEYKGKKTNILNGLNNSEMSEVCEILKNEIGKRNN